MALALPLLLAGAVVLHAGAALAARGLAAAASALGRAALALGALLIGVDLPVLAASLTAAGRGHTEIAAGVVLGAALFLLTVGLGSTLAASRRPLPAPPSMLVLLAPSGAVILGALALADRYVDRVEGLLLLLGYAGYLFLMGRERGAQDPEEPIGPERSTEAEREATAAPRWAAPLAGGVGLLYAGALLLVEGGARLSAATGLGAGFVGAAALGALTMLTRVIPGPRSIGGQKPESAAESLFGSLTALATGILGLAAVVRPLILDTGVNLAFLGVAVLSAIVTVALLLRRRIGWILGVVLLACYATWLVYAAGA